MGNRLTQYGGQTVTYDAEGNMTYGPLGGAFASFTYDQRNQLTSAGGTTYTYDGEGTRVTRGGTTYVTDPVSELSQLLMTYNEDGSVTYYVYAPGYGLMSQETFYAGQPIQYRQFHFDYRGNTIALSDESGMPVRWLL